MHIQGRRSSSRAGRAIQMLRAMETYTKNCYQLCLFLFISNVHLKNNNRNYQGRSQDFSKGGAEVMEANAL